MEVKAGGRVVKNVAGYDLMKLQTGALGTLGVISQLTLKVKPKPEASAAVAFGCDAALLASSLDLLAASKTRPIAVELLNRARQAGIESPDSADWVILVGFEEKAQAVRWQVHDAARRTESRPIRDVSELPDTSFCAEHARPRCSFGPIAVRREGYPCCPSRARRHRCGEVAVEYA